MKTGYEYLTDDELRPGFLAELEANDEAEHVDETERRAAGCMIEARYRAECVRRAGL